MRKEDHEARDRGKKQQCMGKKEEKDPSRKGEEKETSR